MSAPKFLVWVPFDEDMAEHNGKLGVMVESYERTLKRSAAILADCDLINASYIQNGDMPVVWRRFTGRKDTNGVEIYDGHIVEAPHDFGPGGFSKRVFVVRLDDEVGYQWQYWRMSEAVVLGDIYSTPDLYDQLKLKESR